MSTILRHAIHLNDVVFVCVFLFSLCCVGFFITLKYFFKLLIIKTLHVKFTTSMTAELESYQPE